MNAVAYRMSCVITLIGRAPNGMSTKQLSAALDLAPSLIHHAIANLRRAGRAVSRRDFDADCNQMLWYTPDNAPAPVPSKHTAEAAAGQTVQRKPQPGSGVIAGPRIARDFVPLDVAHHIASLRPAGSFRRTA